MAALVQTLPQQSGSVTMLQSRTPSGQPSQQYQQQRVRPGPQTGYRPAAAPIQPYAFTSTPTLNSNSQWQYQQQQYAHLRSGSTPSTSTTSSMESGSVGRSRHFASASMTNLPQTASPNIGGTGSRDDSALPPRARLQSTYQTGTSKATPDRYRRPGPRYSDGMVTPQGSAIPSGSGMATAGHIYTSQPPVSVGKSRRANSFYAGSSGTAAADDMQLYRHPASDEKRRYRRRSMHTLDSADYPSPLTPQELFAQANQPVEPARSQLALPQTQQQPRGDNSQQQSQRSSPSSSRPTTASTQLSSGNNSNSGDMPQHARHGSADSARSSKSNGNHSNNNSRPSSASDSTRKVNVPPRNSSTDVSKRLHNPSPLSKPVTMEPDSAAKEHNEPAAPSSPMVPSSSHSNQASLTDSPAAQHLAAINEKGKKLKGKTSRLRRAFSFGSAAEFRKAGPENGDQPSKEPAKLHKERHTEDDDILDEEQAAIARKQEEGGIGNNIYGRKIFTGSTDNLSISSTASSASIMIRKMGRGMKKGGRSLVGLFRPKSVVGVPAADITIPETSTAAVTMVNVEAERDRVNVNPDPHAQPGGGTGYPRLERNSLDASRSPKTSSERVGSSGTDNSASRRSIVGGDRERAEVLAAVRKGILKHSGSNSPSPRPQENMTPSDLPNIPAITDSPISSAPSTPNSEAQGHKRSESVAIGSEDYFMSALRLRQDTKSAPNTPNSTSKRNATFSPRIVFYDTWPSQEYDRRGEVATCNRLTPMLAQQIKEELNNFKMEMEVHETSKIYTHFF
ncbi:hypothetical protein MKZ38_010359 [Zalerion maritima]|uniref:Protein BNI4 n=1 Tax=Zalerion maritima TaxID=339359 RepID=A0AAD5RZB5_9PEZI|nr:hypothetical protein MKZ38_010359 [Zalerion maritima]